MNETETIEVQGCNYCPFKEHKYCNVGAGFLNAYKYDKNTEVHSNCPLKGKDIIVKIKP